MTLKQWFLFLLILCVVFFGECVYTLQLLLFPNLAESKNATALEYTIVLASFTGAVTICTPFVGNLLNYSNMTPRLLFIFSLFGESLTLIMFGFVNLINNQLVFIGVSIILRIAEGIFISILIVSVYALTFGLFPEKHSKYMMGVLEMLQPFGVMFGPLLGSFLYSIGGFPLPFIAIGILFGISSILIILIKPSSLSRDKIENEEDEAEEAVRLTVEDDTSNEATNSQSQIWTQRKILGKLLIILISTIVISFITSTLEPYLRKTFGSTQLETGLILSVSGMTSIISPIFAVWSYNKLILQIIVFIGLLIQLIGVVLIGPLAIFYRTYWLTVGGMMLIGIGSSCTIFPSVLLMLNEVEKLGYKNNAKITTFLMGYYMTALNLGAMIGPPISGALDDAYGFENSEIFNIVLLGILLVGFLKINK